MGRFDGIREESLDSMAASQEDPHLFFCCLKYVKRNLNVEMVREREVVGEERD